MPVVEQGDAMSENPAERTNIYRQEPQPGEYAWWDDPVEAWYYKFLEGFEDGDGKLVCGSPRRPSVTVQAEPSRGVIGRTHCDYLFVGRVRRSANQTGHLLVD